MLIKLCGVLFIVASTTFLGIRRADDIKEEYRQMRYLQRIICMIESEIRYARSHLGEIFSHIAGHAKEPYKGWMISMARDMRTESEDRFEDMWNREIDGYLKGAGLSENELLGLKQLGEQLGVSDLELQIRFLELYQQQLTLHMEELREGMGIRVRLCHCLGVMSGVLIAILFI